MTISELNFLISAEGKLLLERYASYDEAALFRLLLKSTKKRGSVKVKNTGNSDIKIIENSYLSAAVTLIKLRRQAFGKFKYSEKMFFTPLGLEQSTNENISRYIAARFKANWKIVDLTCGIGGNLIFLAEHCRQVLAIDKNELNLICARANSALYNEDKKIEFILGDAQEEVAKLIEKAESNEKLKNVDAFFLDPARDRIGKSKTRSILNSQPALLEILPKIFKITKNVGVKISPAFDYRELDLLPEKPEVEVISENNTNKVVMLWFGDLKTVDRRGTIINKNSAISYTNFTNQVDTEELHPNFVNFVERPLAYLYEPNKAIIKAHLVDELAIKYDLAKINPHLSFLSSEKRIKPDSPDLWRVFKVLACDLFSWSVLQKFISERRLDKVNIITKRFPLKPEEVYKKLKIKEGSDLFLILTVLGDEKRCFILAEREQK